MKKYVVLRLIDKNWGDILLNIYRFGKEAGKAVTHFDSDFIISRIIKTDRVTQIGCMHLGSNGIIGFHQTSVPQLLLVVNREGWVRGDDDVKEQIKVGDAVYWENGEGHETTTDTGLTAIVIESEALHPSDFMPLK